MRGGEKVLEALCAMFPDADLYTLVHVPGSVTPIIENRRIVTSPLSRLPGIAQNYRRFLPLFPHFIESFRLDGYDLVVSTSSCVAKAAKPRGRARHVSYVHSPMRYLWDLYDDYFGPGRAGVATRLAMALVKNPLRRWDVATTARVHTFVANSKFVAARIERLYSRPAEVVPPPVDVNLYRPDLASPGEEWLVVSAFVPYKRLDVAIRAAELAGVRLAIVGRGPEEAALRRMAGNNVRFLGWIDDAQLAKMYAGCRGLLFPGVEDFGITPLEAMACGRPVIALGEGGALETVVGAAWEGDETGVTSNATGIFVREPTADAFARGIRWVETHGDELRSEASRERALAFRPEVFRERLKSILDREVRLAFDDRPVE